MMRPILQVMPQVMPQGLSCKPTRQWAPAGVATRFTAMSDVSRRVWLYLGVTFAVTWAAWGTLAALTQAGTISLDDPSAMVLLVVGGSAPTAAAYFAAWRTPGAGSLRELTRRVLRFRAPSGLWVVAVTGAVILGMASMALAGLLTDVAWPDAPAAAAGLFVGLLVVSIFFGGLEEVGWRGVLQHAATTRGSNLTTRGNNLLVVNLVIAVVWGVWHLPMFWFVGGIHGDGSVGLFVLAGFGYSAVMTWLYARTHSVALCVVFHAGINAAATSGLAFSPNQMPGFTVQAVVAVIIGTALLLVVSARSDERSTPHDPGGHPTPHDPGGHPTPHDPGGHPTPSHQIGHDRGSPA